MLWWTLRQLRSDAATARKQAAWKLGFRGNEAAVPPLIAALKDGDWSVRVAVIDALGAIGSSSALEPLLAVAAEAEAGREPEATKVRAALATALGRLGPGAVPALVRAVRDRNARVREVAVTALGTFQAAEAETAVIAALGDERSAVRRAVLPALARSTTTGSLAALVGALRHKDAATRRSAATALGARLSQEAEAALAEAVRDRDQGVREAVVEALGRLGTPAAVRTLLAVYQGADRDLRQAAAAALQPLEWDPGDAAGRGLRAVVLGDCAGAAREGEAALPALEIALADRQPATRRGAAAALGTLISPRAAVLLVGVLADHDETVRGAALQALRSLGPVALPAIVTGLESKASAVRGAAREVFDTIPRAPGLVAGLVASCAAGSRAERDGAPVVRVTGPERTERARTAHETIERLLRHAADRVPEAELRLAAGLPDLVLAEDADDPGGEDEIGSEIIRDLASQEIARKARVH